MGRASKNAKTQLMKKPYLSWTGKERLRGLLHWAPGSGRAFELKWGRGEQGAFSATTPLRVALFTASTTMVSHSSRIFHHTAPFPLLHLLEHITPPRAPFRRHTLDSLQWLPANPAWCCRCLSAPELLEISTTCPRFSRSPPLIPHPPVREMSRARVTHA